MEPQNINKLPDCLLSVFRTRYVLNYNKLDVFG